MFDLGVSLSKNMLEMDDFVIFICLKVAIAGCDLKHTSRTLGAVSNPLRNLPCQDRAP